MLQLPKIFLVRECENFTEYRARHLYIFFYSQCFFLTWWNHVASSSWYWQHFLVFYRFFGNKVMSFAVRSRRIVPFLGSFQHLSVHISAIRTGGGGGAKSFCGDKRRGKHFSLDKKWWCRNFLREKMTGLTFLVRTNDKQRLSQKLKWHGCYLKKRGGQDFFRS